jgi:hypothetical protein
MGLRGSKGMVLAEEPGASAAVGSWCPKAVHLGRRGVGEMNASFSQGIGRREGDF